MFNRITIVGLGLIGGSIALDVRAKNAQTYIIAYDASQETLKKAQQLGCIDLAAPTLEDAVKESDLIIICSPLSTYSSIAISIQEHASKQALITDVGSVKQCTVEAFLKTPTHFVPGHPIAGKAESGIEAAQLNLFLNKKIILTPSEQTALYAVRQITQFWQNLGAIVEEMSLKSHDSLYASLSHLPQALAFCVGKLFVHLPSTPALQQHIRIANSSASMWSDIFIANQKFLLPLLEHVLQRLPYVTSNDIEKARQVRQLLDDPVIPLDNLPALAYIIASILIELNQNIHYAGTGFKDMTACLLHYKKLPEAVNGYQTNFILNIHHLIRLIRNQDSTKLHQYLSGQRC